MVKYAQTHIFVQTVNFARKVSIARKKIKEIIIKLKKKRIKKV